MDNLKSFRNVAKGVVKASVLDSMIISTMNLLGSNFNRIMTDTESISAAVEELEATIRLMTQNITDINNQMKIILEQNDEIDSEFGQRIVEIKDVTEKGNQTAEEIKSLGEAAQNISQFVVDISDIADQTNLLALNAAIEAARVGEAGKGFAVVADEIRKLSENTNRLTKNISKGLKVFTQKISKSVVDINSLTKVLTTFAEDIANVRATFEKNKEASDQIGVSINQISLAIDENSKVLSDIFAKIVDVNATAQEVNKIFTTIVNVNATVSQMEI